MQRAVMAKHVKPGDLLYVEGEKAVVRHVETYPRLREVVIRLDLDFDIRRSWDEYVYRYEGVSEARASARRQFKVERR